MTAIALEHVSKYWGTAAAVDDASFAVSAGSFAVLLGPSGCGRPSRPCRASPTRPLTVGLQVFSSTDQGVDWSIITAATLMTSAPLLVGFLLFQRQFVQSFMRAGIR
jgi:ABC-type lipopolysaccharide export system ATPase subunit